MSRHYQTYKLVRTKSESKFAFKMLNMEQWRTMEFSW